MLHCRISVWAALLIVVGTCLGAPASAAGAATSGQLLKLKVLPNLGNYALPPSTAGCRGAVALTGGASRVPMTVSVLKDGSAQESVNVCIDGKGPFPFEIDTGADRTTIAASLARHLGLPDSGPPITAGGLGGCLFTTQPVSVSSWSLAGLNLAPQSLTSATSPSIGGRGNPVGLLGSDVLARFGAVRLDFAKQKMTLAAPEGPASTGIAVNSMTGPPPSGAVTDGQTGTTVPATVVLAPGTADMHVKVSFKSGPSWTFSLDTGSNGSFVSSSLAKTEHLASTHLLQNTGTACSSGNVPVVHSGSWSLPGVQLQPTLLVSLAIDAANTGGGLRHGGIGPARPIRMGHSRLLGWSAHCGIEQRPSGGCQKDSNAIGGGYIPAGWSING